MDNLVGTRATTLRQLLKTKTVSAREIVAAHFDHIKRHEPAIDAFVCLTEELAQRQAAAVDEKVARGETLPPLAGVPVAIKDNMCVPGYKTTCASKILHNFVPDYQSTAVGRLFDAGAICLGKTNMDEFAMGSSTENSSLKPTRNPWNTNFVPGGSSGGSAAAVAAAFTTIALGSDTGGSIRQPASFCGVLGMKPTYGLVSRFGLVAFASSLDQIGPFARSVEDLALTLTAIAGHDPQDSTSLEYFFDDKGAKTQIKNGEVDFAKDLTLASAEDLVRGLRIGIIKELVGEGIDEDVRILIETAAKSFVKLGAQVDEVSIPQAVNALPTYYVLCTAEASANLARFDGVRYGYRNEAAQDILSMYYASRQEGFGAEVKRRIMLGTFVLSTGYYDAYYKKAQSVRQLLKQDFDRIFQNYDLVLSPTAPTTAFQFNEKTADPLAMYLSDIASIPVNLAGLPGLSIPCGFGSKNMPVGLQIIGKPLADAKVLRAASAYEQTNAFPTGKSPLLSASIN
jgi:aspartyl-tRNA(Asn)/glutamyl-tRNA(Gln) amidotransferase subunit A